MTDAEKLDLLEERAERLRRVGVSRFRLTADGIDVELVPHYPDVPQVAGEVAPAVDDPMDDPWTYGDSGSGDVPGFSRLRRRESLVEP